MPRLSLTPALALAAAASLVLAACSGDEPEPSPSATASPTPVESAAPSASPEPSPIETAAQDGPEPTFAPHMDAEDLLIWNRGLGPLAVGNLPPETNPGAAMVAYYPEFCGTTTDPVFDNKGRWAPYGYDDSDVDLAGDPVTPFAIEADDAAIHRIDVLGVGPRTGRGIGLGSTLSELQAEHFRTLVGPVDGLISRAWIVEDARGSLVFETATYREGFTDEWMEPGDEEMVVMIRILHPEYPADFTVLDGGDQAGDC